MLDLAQGKFFWEWEGETSAVFQLCTHGQIDHILLKLFFSSDFFLEKHDNKKNQIVWHHCHYYVS